MSLILVNGKRRHRAGVIAELGGSLASGSQGADLSSIPALAIQQVEVLRDGASAQYGSDAIAGVINFGLKENNDGLTIEGRTGEYMEGDGTLMQFAANAGLPLGDDGFANVTFQWREQDPTVRSTQRTDAATLIAAGNNDIPQPFAQVWGAPEYKDDYNVFINAGIQLTENQELYGFGNVGGRQTIGGFSIAIPMIATASTPVTAFGPSWTPTSIRTIPASFRIARLCRAPGRAATACLWTQPWWPRTLQLWRTCRLIVLS